MAKNNRPEIRFNGFSDNWKERKLSEIADIIGGGTPSTSVTEYWNGDIHWYSPTEIGDKVYANGSVKKITELGLENSSARILPANRTILFTSRAGIGDMAILSKEGATNQGFQSLVLKKDFHPYFIYSANKLIKKYALSKASGSTFLEISSKVLGNMNLFVPEYVEQKTIGDFFENIDNLIHQHQQRFEKLVILKKAMLDKMFPKQGQRIPEVRFKGFDEDWDQVEVGEIFKVTRGNVLAVSKLSKTPNDIMQYPVYSSQTTNNGLLGYYNEYLFENAITWTTDGANAGTVKFRKGKFYSTNVNGVLLSDEGFANKMVSEAINKLSGKYVSRVGNPKLMNNVMSQIKILIPKSLDEQILLSENLDSIENAINQHLLQLDKIKNIKSALIRQMFI